MSQNTTLDNEHIISDLTDINAASDTVTHDVQAAAIDTLHSRSPLARAADDKEKTGNRHFAFKLPYCEHTDCDQTLYYYTNIKTTNPSDVPSLSCGTSNEARGSLITTALREIIFRLRQRSERFTKGRRKGAKSPPRSQYKFYKPIHLENQIMACMHIYLSGVN